MTARKLAFEELQEERVFHLPETRVTAEEIAAFSSQFDPEPSHPDEEAEPGSALSAAGSGWHAGALFMRMFCEAILLDSTSQGSPGITEMRWNAPVRAGDTLSGHITVLSRRILKSRPGLGLVIFRHVVKNQRGETVMECDNPVFFGLRHPRDDA